MKKFLSFLMMAVFSASLFAATYTVAGDNTTVFGKAWTPAETANDMTLVDGLYTFAKTDVTLPAGSIAFKVCQDHAWTNSWPAQNYSLSIPASGKYDITITFNESTKDVNAKADKKEDVVVLPSIAMHGNFLGSWADTENFTVAEDNASASLTLTIAAGNYEFGMRIGGSGNWTSNGAAFTRENPSAVVEAGQGNLKLAADEAGEYTFTWTFATNTLAVTFPAKAPETPKYYLKHNFDGENWEWKEMTMVDADTYILENIVIRSEYFNLNTAASDEGSRDINLANIKGYLPDYSDVKLGVLDTVVFMYTPSAYASMDPTQPGLSAIEVRKYVDPVGPVAHTYTVAGSSTDLFGTAWAPTNEDNDMVLVEGLYTWEKTDLTLAAGSVQFKVCEDHAWTNSWPAQNYNLTIPEAGIYTITITFNAESKEVNAVATKTGSAVVIPTVAMHGNFLGSWADTENFTVAEDNATASLTLTIAAGDYEFGMRIGGAGNWTANGAEFSRQNPSAVVVTGQGNLKLAADEAGEYTFTWTFATNTLAITFPTPTGFEETVAAEKATKILRNGQIFILKGDKIYNVMGGTIK